MLDIEKIRTAINMISNEKKLSKDVLVDIIESAIKTAYKKDYGNKDEEVNVKLDLETGELDISVEKTVVKEVKNPSLEISFEDLWDDADSFSEWDVIEIDVSEEVAVDGDIFGRIASQAARQVIIQKIGDSEKEKIFELFSGKEGEVINMRVDMVEGGKVIFDYNGNNVILPRSEQVPRDNYSADQRFYLYVAEVSNAGTGSPKVVLSRRRAEIVPAIFSEYVPEIGEGVITIDRIVRQAGVKTKLLVSSNYEEIDPAGTLIGQKGMRVKSVMEELSGEKIDIIPNHHDVREVIKRSLTPAEVVKVLVNEEEESALVYIAAGDRARAVGRNGVNVNLASELVGYKISIEEVEAEESDESEESSEEL